MREVEFQMPFRETTVTIKGRVIEKEPTPESPSVWQLHDFTVTDSEGQAVSMESGEEGDAVAAAAVLHAEENL